LLFEVAYDKPEFISKLQAVYVNGQFNLCLYVEPHSCGFFDAADLIADLLRGYKRRSKEVNCSQILTAHSCLDLSGRGSADLSLPLSIGNCASRSLSSSYLEAMLNVVHPSRSTTELILPVP